MEKLYAILENDIIVDGWLAESLEEAQRDNPSKTVIDMTLENSPAVVGHKLKGME